MSGYHIIRASSEQDFGLKAKQAFQAAMIGIAPADLPRVVLPTGSTPKPFYQALIDDGKIRPFDYLQLDEYVGLPPEDPILFSNWLARDVLDHLNIKNRMIFKSAADPSTEVARIREWHSQRGRIDVAVIGIGENGHVGFNEPGADFNDRAHIEKLTPQTRASNKEYWGREVPEYAITLGISELRLASHTILLARGVAKAEILQKALYGEMSSAVPASYLQRQRNVTVIADDAALSCMPK